MVLIDLLLLKPPPEEVPLLSPRMYQHLLNMLMGALIRILGVYPRGEGQRQWEGVIWFLEVDL